MEYWPNELFVRGLHYSIAILFVASVVRISFDEWDMSPLKFVADSNVTKGNLSRHPTPIFNNFGTIRHGLPK